MAVFKRAGPEREKAWETVDFLYKTYRQSMFKTACRILEDEARAEDAVHDTFLAVAKVTGRLEGMDEARIERYLLRSVKNKAVDFLRARKREEQSRQRLRELEAGAAAFSRELSNRLEEREQSSALKRLLLELPEQDRELLTLFFAEGCTPEETAKALGISRKTVYNRVHAIIKKLQAALRKEGFLG